MLIVARGTNAMRRGLLGGSCLGLHPVAALAALDGRLALVRFVTLDAIGVSMSQLVLVAIGAAGGRPGLRMALVTGQAV